MRRKMNYYAMICFMALSFINKANAQTTNKFDFERIEDNSFLIEEAYNQDPGVIQHISGFQYMNKHLWFYTFTDEWPVPGRKHQLSTTIPVLNNNQTGFGDIALNYRYQAIFRTRFAFSPRFSLLLPSGDYRKGLGSGTFGYQLSLPFSYLLTTKIATHYNLGVTYTPNAKNTDASKFNQTVYNYGLSMIILLTKNFNFMFEAAGNTTYIKAKAEKTIISNSFYLNPGFRFAINFKSGLQIVPGLAVPIGIGSSHGSNGIFMYLSFEHPLWKPVK
jgi:hypothetical protein